MIPEYMCVLKTKVWLYTEKQINRSSLPYENYSTQLKG